MNMGLEMNNENETSVEKSWSKKNDTERLEEISTMIEKVGFGGRTKGYPLEEKKYVKFLNDLILKLKKV